MGDAGRSVFAGGVAIAAVFGSVFVLDLVLRRLGVQMPEVDVPARIPPLPARSVESESGHGLRAVDHPCLRGSRHTWRSSRDGEAKSPPIHKLLHATEFGSDDWSAMCTCGVIQHGCPSYAGCQAWIVVHGSFAAKGLG